MIAYHSPLSIIGNMLTTCHITRACRILTKKKGFHMWIMFIKWQFIIVVTYKCELTISRTIVENSGGLATSWLAPIVYPLIILTSNLTFCIDCWIFNSIIFLSYLDKDFHHKMLTSKQRLKDFSNSYPSFLFLHSFFLVVCSYIEFDKLKILNFMH
jgi:hypothetical protein